MELVGAHLKRIAAMVWKQEDVHLGLQKKQKKNLSEEEEGGEHSGFWFTFRFVARWSIASHCLWYWLSRC